MAVDRELGAGAWSYFGDPRAISHDGVLSTKPAYHPRVELNLRLALNAITRFPGGAVNVCRALAPFQALPDPVIIRVTMPSPGHAV